MPTPEFNAALGPTLTNPDVLYPNWSSQGYAFHNTRVLCDMADLSVLEKNILCACIYQESQFLNYYANGIPVHHDNVVNGKISSTDWGMCQINDYFHIGPNNDFSSVDYVLQNPDKVVQWMIEQYKAGCLKMWVSYSSGAYEQWLRPNSAMWKLALPLPN